MNTGHFASEEVVVHISDIVMMYQSATLSYPISISEKNQHSVAN